MAEPGAAWSLDQLAKSAFFHQKLHEWGLLRTAKILEEIKGEDLAWELEALDISQNAWNKIIHKGIKPIRVFAHPAVLTRRSCDQPATIECCLWYRKNQ